MKKIKSRILSLLMSFVICSSTIFQPIVSYAVDDEVTKSTDSQLTVSACVSSGKGTVTITDDYDNEYEVTDEATEPLIIDVDSEQILHVEVKAAEGFEISHFLVSSASGTVIEDLSDEELLNGDSIFEIDLTITNENLTIEVSLDEIVVEENESAEEITEDDANDVLDGEEITEKESVEGLDEEESIETLAAEESVVANSADTNETQMNVSESEDIFSEEVGTAIVTKDVTFDENGEIVIGEEIDLANIPMPMATVGSNVTITPGSTTLWYGNWSTCKFTMKTDNGTYMGYCAQPNTPTPSGVYTVSKIDGTTEFGKKLKIALMFGENGPWYSESTALFGGCSWSAVYAYLHAMIGVHYSGQTNGLTATQVLAVTNALQEQYETRGNLSELNDYTVYVAYNNKQDIVWLEKVTDVPPKGNLTLQKTSANTSLTNNNSCYSLANAVYGVYSNQQCTNKVATLTTDASGKSNTVELNAGTYYIKETTAPKGYALDTTVRTVTVTAGGSTTIKVTDTPQSDPVGVLLGKIDKETNTNKPQGSASLEGAQFTVKYYDVQMGTDPAKSGYTAVRTWVLKTDEDGFCYLDDEWKVSGDGFYYDPNGYATLPLGTITIQETKAPEGYLLNSEVFVRQITSNGTANRVDTYNYPIIPETTLNLDILKTEAGTARAIPGVVFKHTLPNGTTETVTTDEDGKAEFKGLTYGTHVVEEVSAPDGYTVNPGKVTFTVATDNTIKLTSNTAKSATGNMTFSVQSDGCPLLKVEDVLAPYSLLIHKVNEKGRVLEGAEFTLYSDADCKTKVASSTSDAEGLVTFGELTVGAEYYLKETKAPTGYRIPVNSDGSDIVYKIKTESAPVNGTFEYFINDVKHTETAGDYAITGTQAERVVNLKIVNNTGVQMPKTGTSTGLIIFLCGIGAMAGVLIYSTKKRKGQEKNDEEK